MIGNIKHFRFWCQKVIPLVYDNSLSYYEVLCKIVHYLNHVIEDINEIPEYIDEKVKESLDEEHLRQLITEVFQTLEDAISDNNEGQNTNFSKDYSKLGTLLWHDNKLYETIRVIDQGDTIIEDVNIKRVNFGDMFNDFINEVKKNFTEFDDGKRETTSMDRTVHQLVWLDDILYEVIKPIAEGNAYIYNGDNKNVEPITMDYLYQYILGLIADEAQTRAEEDARIELELGDLIVSRVDAEAETRAEEDARIELELGDLIASRVDAEAETRAEEDARIELDLRDLITSKVNAEAQTRADAVNNLQGQVGDLSFLTTTDRDNLVAAINEVNSRAAGAYDKADIRNYGGVADATTDNTAAFQACMADNNVVYLPRYNSSNYYFASTILLEVNGQSVIADEGTVITSSATNAFEIRGSYITIKNFRIVTTHNVFYFNSSFSTIQFINIENVVAQNANMFIYDNSAATNRITNLYIDKCYSFANASNGIYMTKAFAFIFLNNTTIIGIGTTASKPCFMFENCEGLHMSHCEAEGGLTDGSHAQHIGFSFVGCQAVWLERCMADTLDSHAFVFQNTNYVYMVSCTAALCCGHGIAILGTTSRHYMITNCYIQGRYPYSPAPAGAHGIYNYNNMVTVSNCIISNMTGHAIANNSQGQNTIYNGINTNFCQSSFYSSAGVGIVTNLISAITSDAPTWGGFNHVNNLVNGVFG